jgi:hypothetical protein
MAAPKIIKTDHSFTVFSIEADRDYLLARQINFFGGGFHSRAGFMGQQACEKYMKAVSVQATGKYLQTHILLKLAEFCAALDPYFAEPGTQKTLQTFDYFEQVGRYGAAANFDPLAVQQAEIETAGVMLWKEHYLQLLDAFVFRTRSMLDYQKANFSDSLRAVLKRDRTDILASTWQGKMPLRVVLTKNNRYFRP